VEVIPQDRLETLAAQAPEPPKSNGAPCDKGGGYSVDVMRSMIVRLDKLPQSIQGQNGSKALVRAACNCCWFTADETKQRQGLEHYNATKCSPPWSDRELSHALDSARKKVGDGIGTWELDRQAWKSKGGSQPAAEFDGAEVVPICFDSLLAANPKLHDPVIEMLLRTGETMNVIAPAKRGKSWIIYAIILSMIAGRRWLNNFQCHPGKVLLVDAELHPATLANRLPKVAAALGIEQSEYGQMLDVVCIRGKGWNIHQVASWLRSIPKGTYKLIVLDALYRLLPPDCSENDAAKMTAVYNAVDGLAEQQGAAVVIVHHSTKGSQSTKEVVDIGSGSGAIARAPDSHVVLRQHEDPDCVVLEAAVRSWAPVVPLGLRWGFPLWTPDIEIDTGALKGLKSDREEKQSESDLKGIEQIKAVLAKGSATERAIRRDTGIGHARLQRLLGILKQDEEANYRDALVGGNSACEWFLSEGGGSGGLDHPQTTGGEGGCPSLKGEMDHPPPSNHRKAEKKKRRTTPRKSRAKGESVADDNPLLTRKPGGFEV